MGDGAAGASGTTRARHDPQSSPGPAGWHPSLVLFLPFPPCPPSPPPPSSSPPTSSSPSHHPSLPPPLRVPSGAGRPVRGPTRLGGRACRRGPRARHIRTLVCDHQNCNRNGWAKAARRSAPQQGGIQLGILLTILSTILLKIKTILETILCSLSKKLIIISFIVDEDNNIVNIVHIIHVYC